MSNNLLPEEFDIVTGLEEGGIVSRTLNTNSPSNQSLLEDFQTIDEILTIPYSTNSCFDLNNLPKTTELSTLLSHLCELMIRFDSAPNKYQKADYEHFVKTITNALIYLYTRDQSISDLENVIHFMGIATLDTDPQQERIANKYKYPGMYLANTVGVYTNFNIEVTSLANSIVYFFPKIENGIFTEYEKFTYNIDGSKWELVEGLLRTKDSAKITLQDISEIDSDLGAEDKFLNKKGEFVIPSHSALNDKNAEPEFQHVTQEEKDLITLTATIINGQSVTREELLALIGNNELIPNSSYRITNYTTTTTQTDTISAGHDFDIIVTALSTNELSEIASCVRKSGDTYFANAELEAWEIKYCINNDTSRFYWADVINGKGVIYYMKDEWGNECPYDFKNIQFKKADVFLYTFGGATDNSLTGGCHHNTMMDYKPSSALRLNFNTFGSSCSYNTFGNYCSDNSFGDSCSNNRFGDNCQNNTFELNCQTNSFGDFCENNTFGAGCISNTFGNKCSGNTFGYTCTDNTFGDSCSNNTLNNNFQYNSFGIICQSNTFGIYCQRNMFGNNCTHNMFGINCQHTTLENNCVSNRLGSNCYRNTFGSSCNDNSFGSSCSYNTLGSVCESNTFGNNCYGNIFGNNCFTNMFGNNCSYNTFGTHCQVNNFYTGTSGTVKKSYIKYIVLENGCRNNNFYSDVTTSSASYLQRIRIKGLQNTTATDTQITLPAPNTNYEWLIYYTSSGVLKQHFLGYGLVNTETTKETLVKDDKVTIYDSETGDVVLTDKSNVGVKIDDTITSNTKVWSSQKTATVVDTKQDTLVSGTNIKTINGISILGAGNIDIDIINTNVTNNTGTIVIDTTPNWQRVNITSGSNTLVLDYENGVLPTKNREYLLIINNTHSYTKILTLPTVSFIKGGITYNFMNTAGSVPIEKNRSIEVNVIFFFIDATTCNIRTQITQFI